MKPIHLYIALALLVVIGLYGCGGGGSSGSGVGFPIIGTPVQPAPEPVVDTPKTCQIELWGDSVLYGGYSLNSRIESPVALSLQAWNPLWKIQDHSENGGSATYKLSTFLQDELAPIVVLQYGINDVGLGLPYEASMRSMIEYAKSKGSTVILTGFSQGEIAYRTYGNSIVEKLALEYGLLFADWGSVDFFPEEDTYDGLHPKQNYSKRLAFRLEETIRQTGCV